MGSIAGCATSTTALGFYILRDRAVLMQEPPTTLTAVAELVPRSLRGEVYNLYLVQMTDSWNEQPTYVFDEWTAYANGAEARQALGIKDRAETVRYALEFCVYAACVPRAAHSHDLVMGVFYRRQVERVMELYQASGIKSDYLDRFRDRTRRRAATRVPAQLPWLQVDRTIPGVLMKLIEYPETRQVFSSDCGANALVSLLVFAGVEESRRIALPCWPAQRRPGPARRAACESCNTMGCPIVLTNDFESMIYERRSMKATQRF